MRVLLVSIEKYADPVRLPNIPGAKKDMEGWRKYFAEVHHACEKDIHVLQDEEATRDNIIAAFRDHFINAEVQKGEAMVFQYSGHGTRLEAPEGWPVEPEEVKDEHGLTSVILPPKVEAICPYDEGLPIEGDTTGRKYVIPDRSVGALLEQAAEKHGSNITVILDCCYSGHGTRGQGPDASSMEEDLKALGWAVRGVDSSAVTPLPEDVDADILEASTMRVVRDLRKHRGSFVSNKHVLLAACSPFQEAHSQMDVGGLFSYQLVKALRDSSSVTSHALTTYSNVCSQLGDRLYLLRLDRFEAFRKKWPGWKTFKQLTQDPQFEGPIDRLLFQEVSISPGLYAVKERTDDVNKVTIYAGNVHNVHEGTTMELYELGNQFQLRGAGICTADVEKVEGTSCIARIPDRVSFADRMLVAKVLHNPYILKVAVEHAEGAQVQLDLSKYHDDTSSTAWEIAAAGEKADLILRVDEENGVIFLRHDRILKDLRTPPPRIEPADVLRADFSVILDAISRFNANLAISNPIGTIANNFVFNLHLLQKPTYQGIFHDSPVHALKEQIPFGESDQEAVIEKNDSAKYAFVLQNNTESCVYPFIVYFDPASYEICIWHSPFNRSQGMRPGASLQIGGGPEHGEPFEFFLPPGVTRDTCFVKFYLVENAITSMDVEQRGVLGLDQDNRSNVPARSGGRMRGRQKAEPAVTPERGGWDTLLRKITVTDEVHENN